MAITINHIFFKKMEVIQSKVYPNLYLIKYPIDDEEEIKKYISQLVFHKVNSEFVGNQEAFKTKDSYAEKSIAKLNYTINIYEYYKGWGTNPFGEAGTAHFIENKEDPGGFSSEELIYYKDYLLAKFNIKFCENDTNNYFGTISYYKNSELIKTETLINLCEK